ncbi:esterase [Winogradskyella maritima]|uniref:Alpha/beta hydrolase n=1 Tax=Winogradskyella maritima TaxID=1517766 RepID=A0ABV8AJD3_9FLAO|nr:esterase [Winogradskyella maritima]
MNLQEKEVQYSTKNSYSTLNQNTSKTKNVWFVFHGMGYLSKYFLKYFKGLPPVDNYIIAPQAPSKYYIQPKMHVGANWLTRDNTEAGVENIMNYLDEILAFENISDDKNIILFGYSQGVSIISRLVAKRQLKCDILVLHSGGIPVELTNEDFEFLPIETKVKLICGKQDQYLTTERIDLESQRAKDLFGERLEIVLFEGKHEVNVDYINNLI